MKTLIGLILQKQSVLGLRCMSKIFGKQLVFEIDNIYTVPLKNWHQPSFLSVKIVFVKGIIHTFFSNVFIIEITV